MPIGLLRPTSIPTTGVQTPSSKRVEYALLALCLHLQHLQRYIHAIFFVAALFLHLVHATNGILSSLSAGRVSSCTPRPDLAKHAPCSSANIRDELLRSGLLAVNDDDHAADNHAEGGGGSNSGLSQAMAERGAGLRAPHAGPGYGAMWASDSDDEGEGLQHLGPPLQGWNGDASPPRDTSNAQRMSTQLTTSSPSARYSDDDSQPAASSFAATPVVRPHACFSAFFLPESKHVCKSNTCYFLHSLPLAFCGPRNILGRSVDGA
jgi:hypothetical protein